MAEEWYKKDNHQVRLQEKDLLPYEEDLYKKGATLKQLMWRQWKLQDISQEQFQQEFPSFPEEAFISTDTGVFDAKTITERYNYLPELLAYNEIKSLPQSIIQYYNKGLYVYKEIKKNRRYYAGVDTSAGLKQDNSAIVILDEDGEQVAVFFRNDIPVYQFAKITYDIGLWANYCMYLPERNTYGLDLITRLRKEMGYINVLKTKHFDKITGKRTFEYGWYTDAVSKTKLISDFKEAFETGTTLINDKETLDEMKIYVEDKGKMNNIKGANNHDDLVIAYSLALQAYKSNKWYL